MIIKIKQLLFIDDYGNMESYISAMLEEYLSGHCNVGSAYESCDHCGTCDGSRCHECTKIYKVTIWKKPTMSDEGYLIDNLDIWRLFSNLDEANEFYKSKTQDIV